MAFALSISLGRKQAGSLLIQNFDRRKRENLRRGLEIGGNEVRTQIIENVSGPSHTLNPGQNSPFPGTLFGVLKGSIRSKLFDRGTGVRIGPGSESKAYSAIHEFGGMAGRGGRTRIPKRSYIRPAWEEKREEVFKIIRKWLFRPLR